MIDHIYFLALNDSQDRKANVQRQIGRLNEAGFDNCEMFKNYRWPRAITKFLKEKLFPQLGEGIFSNTCGQCAIMKDALQNGYETIVVCEDDICLTTKAIDFIKNFPTKYANLEFDAVRIWYGICGKDADNLDEYKVDCLNDEIFRFTMLPPNHYAWGNQCYMVNRKFMECYIDYFETHINVADEPMTNYDEFVNKYGLKVFLCKDTSMILGCAFSTSLHY